MIDLLLSMQAHTWFCVFFRSPGQPFTRPQRLTVLFSMIFTSFFLLCLFYGTADDNDATIKILMSAVLCSICTMPTTVVVQMIFKISKLSATRVWRRRGEDPYPLNPTYGDLTVRVIEARNLPNMDFGRGGDVSDPFVCVEFEDKYWKSRTVWDNLDPVWSVDQAVTFPVRNEGGEVAIRVLDDDGGQLESLADLLGVCTVHLSYVLAFLSFDDFSGNAAVDDWFDLEGGTVPSSFGQPRVRLYLEYEKYNSPAFRDEEHKERWEELQRTLPPKDTKGVGLQWEEGDAPVGGGAPRSPRRVTVATDGSRELDDPAIVLNADSSLELGMYILILIEVDAGGDDVADIAGGAAVVAADAGVAGARTRKADERNRAHGNYPPSSSRVPAAGADEADAPRVPPSSL
eukprot:gene28915-biopygen58535